MVRSPTDARSLDALLRDLGPRLRRGGAPESASGAAPGRLASGVPALDRLLGGGLPRGRLSEIAGPLSSGRTSLALALLARVTAAGELTAVVDASDAFDPASAAAAGVDLQRVLWVRAPEPRAALKSAERLLEVRGFALVALDWVALPPPAPAVWRRLARAAAGTGTALLVLSAERAAGTQAEVAVETRLRGASFTGTPVLLEALESEIAVVRCRAAPPQRAASVRLRSTAA